MTADGAGAREHDVLAVVREALVLVLDVRPEQVDRPTRLVEDLQADSLAIVELAEIVESRLGAGGQLRIDDADLEKLHTVGEVVDYVLARL